MRNRFCLLLFLLTQFGFPASALDCDSAVAGLRNYVVSNPINAFDTGIVVGGLPVRTTGTTTIDRAMEIVLAVMTPKSAVFEQFVRETGIADDLQNPAIWNHYFHYYDLSVFSRGHVENLETICAEMERMVIRDGPMGYIDFGSGTGNLAAFCLPAVASLRATLIDTSAEGITLAKHKLSHLAVDPNRLDVWKVNLLDWVPGESGTHRNRFVVFGNVLYTLPPDDKAKALSHALRELPVGGKLAIYDPIKGTNILEFLRATYGSIIENGGPMNESGFLAAAALNRILTAGNSSYATTPEETLQLAEKVGFRRLESKSVYYGAGVYQLFVKP